MKIVHLCLSAFFIDHYSYQENLLPKYHVKMGYDVTVIASLFSFDEHGKGCYLQGFSEYNDDNGFHVVRLPYRRPIKFNRILRHYEKFGEILEREAPDIIFVHNVSFGDVKVLIDYIKQHSTVKVFADNHADYVNSAKNFFSKYVLHSIIWRFYAKQLEPYLSKCYGVTPMRCRFLKEVYHMGSDKIEFLPMGVDDESIPHDRKQVRERVRSELAIPFDDKVILTGGKIDRLKNTHILLSAIQQIANNQIHLIICGTITSEMGYLKNFIDKMSNVHYLGWCSSERVIDCMIASDMVCFPGTHSTLWEQSVGVGLPAIFKRWSEMEHVNVNNNCIMVRGDDEYELIKAIQSMFANYSIYRDNAKKAAESFLYSVIAKKSIS